MLAPTLIDAVCDIVEQQIRLRASRSGGQVGGNG